MGNKEDNIHIYIERNRSSKRWETWKSKERNRKTMVVNKEGK